MPPDNNPDPIIAVLADEVAARLTAHHGPPMIRTKAQLDAMTPKQINAARIDARIDAEAINADKAQIAAARRDRIAAAYHQTTTNKENNPNG